MSTSAGGDRRLSLALVAVLVLVAASAAIWLRRDPPPAPPFPADLGVLSPPVAEFVDTDHGYVMLGRCTAATCEAWVGVTHDGGQNWHAAVVPGLGFSGAGAAEDISAQLIALDAEHAVVEGSENFDQLSSRSPGRRWYTSDGGRTWSSAPWEPVDLVDEIPAGAYVSAILSADAPDRIALRLIRLDGTSAVLARSRPTPVEVPLDGEVTRAPSGTHWVVARGPTMTVFGSGDRGRTWTRLPFPDGHPVEGRRYEFYAGNGVTVYLVDTTGFRVWRSRDMGVTWEALTVPFSAGIPDGGLSGMSLPDGRLLLYEPFDALFVTRATGSSFERADPELAFAAQGRALIPSAEGLPLVAGADGSRRPLPFGCFGGRCSW